MNHVRQLSIACGITQHRICITDYNNNPVDVTQQAINAVRDYMVDDIPDGKTMIGYQWKRADGKIVKLICTVEESK